MKNKLIKKAFTLIELLVVVSIITLLISILLPALNLARDKARLVVCVTNLHSLGIYQTMYHNEENKQYYFSNLFTISKFINIQIKYNVPLTLFDCPGTTEKHIYKSLFIDYRTYYIKSLEEKIDNIKRIHPSEFPSLWDNFYLTQIFYISLRDSIKVFNQGSPNHKYKYLNVLFLDSHVETRGKYNVY